jgi:hypothetical protein
MSRVEIIAAIRECAGELKRNPGLADLLRIKNLKSEAIRKRFGYLAFALRAAGRSSKNQD